MDVQSSSASSTALVAPQATSGSNTQQTHPPTTSAVAPNENLFDYVKRHLSTSEYETYLVSIVAHLSSQDPFPIPFDTVVEWLGKLKANLKRTLLGKLKKDEHYQVFIRSDENLGGRPEEEIWLSSRGIKILCARSKGPRAEEIQDYFVHVEELVVKYTVEQLTKEKDGLAKLAVELEKVDLQKYRIDAEMELKKYRINTEITAKLETDKHNLTCDMGNTQYFRKLDHEKEMAAIAHQNRMESLEYERQLLEQFGYPMRALPISQWIADFLTASSEDSIGFNSALEHYNRLSGRALSRLEFTKGLADAGVDVKPIMNRRRLQQGIRGFRFKNSTN